jgi:hypothetical protein
VLLPDPHGGSTVLDHLVDAKELAGTVVCGARRRSLECMRFGNVEIRPLGGGLGCLLMVLFSVVASVVLTVLVNLLL